jgi:hypothetical protein
MTGLSEKNRRNLIKKTARTSQKEEEVGELPRATEDTGGRRSFQVSNQILFSYSSHTHFAALIIINNTVLLRNPQGKTSKT